MMAIKKCQINLVAINLLLSSNLIMLIKIFTHQMDKITKEADHLFVKAQPVKENKIKIRKIVLNFLEIKLQK